MSPDDPSNMTHAALVAEVERLRDALMVLDDLTNANVTNIHPQSQSDLRRLCRPVIRAALSPQEGT